MDSTIVNIKDRPFSCEFSITSKGLWSANVKAYGKTAEEARGTALYEAEKAERICQEKNKFVVGKDKKED